MKCLSKWFQPYLFSYEIVCLFKIHFAFAMVPSSVSSTFNVKCYNILPLEIEILIYVSLIWYIISVLLAMYGQNSSSKDKQNSTLQSFKSGVWHKNFVL